MTNKLVGEDLIKFIRAYRNCECLWNTSSPLYRNVMLRIKCYNQISNEFEMSEMDVKKKINNLRTCFMKEWKRVEASKLEAQADESKIYQPTMHWFKEMMFLSDTLLQKSLKAKNKKLAKNVQNNTTFDDDYLQDTPDDYNPASKFDSVDKMDTYHDSYISESSSLTIEPAIKLEENTPTITQIDSYSPSPEPMTIKRPQASENMNNYSMNSSIPYDIPKTEVDDFCKSLASQMKNLSLRSIVELQMDIQNLVSKKRLAEMLNSGLQ